MNRIIKFRFWNKEKKIMCYKDEDDSSSYWDGVNCSTVELINNELNSDFTKEEYEIMQFTGLNDKNGKEIYEGDIVAKETFDETKTNLKNISYAKVIYIEELAGFYLVDKDNKILWEVGEDKYNIEVTRQYIRKS